MCDCCKGQLTRDDVTDEDEPCPYECSYEQSPSRKKRQVPQMSNMGPQRPAPQPPFMGRPGPDSSFGVGPSMRRQQERPRNVLTGLLQPRTHYLRNDGNSRSWYSFNRQSIELKNAPDHEPVSGMIIPDDNDILPHDRADQDRDDDDDDDEDDDVVVNVDLPHCNRNRREPPDGPQGQDGRPPRGGPPPKDGRPPPSDGRPPPKDGGRDCTYKDIRLVGKRRKRAVLEELILKLATFK